MDNLIIMSKEEVVTVDKDKDLRAEFKRIGGSNSDDWNHIIYNQTVCSSWVGNDSDKTKEARYRGTVLALRDISPQDILEGMIAGQLIASHNAAMECYRRAMIPDQPAEGRAMNLSQANKLSRTHVALLEALNRHRGKGQQKVTVEHVHIHNGGQAIVGNVTGGGASPKLKDQPHAKIITDAPIQAMRCEDKERATLSVASDAERSLPDARRPKSRRAKG